MSEDPKLRDDTSPETPLAADDDEAYLGAVDAFADELREYLGTRANECPSAVVTRDFLSDAVLIAALKLLRRDGDYPMDEARFWQIVDQHLPFHPSCSSTEERADLLDDAQAIFAAACTESFEDGFDGNFSCALSRFILEHANTAVDIVSDIILREHISPDVAAEALRCLAEMDNQATYEARRTLLERSLGCSSHIVRDGAVIGLADLSDPHAIPSLEAAAAREKHGLLHTQMLELVNRLKGIAD